MAFAMMAVAMIASSPARHGGVASRRRLLRRRVVRRRRASSSSNTVRVSASSSSKTAVDDASSTTISSVITTSAPTTTTTTSSPTTTTTTPTPIPMTNAAFYSTLSAPPEWARDSSNPPLSGNFAPVVGECELRDLEIVGALPPGVSGVYLRNGPNPAREPLLGADRYHWFDGDGMIHWIRLEVGEGDEGEAAAVDEQTAAADEIDYDDENDEAKERRASASPSPHPSPAPRNNRQRASYGRRYVETRGFARERAANRPLYTGLRDINPVWRVLLPRLAEKVRLDWRSPDAPFWVIQSKNTANNGLKYHAGRLLATYESGCAYELELGPELRTLGPCDFDGTLDARDFWTDTMTAHAKTCATTGEMIAIGYNLVDVDGDGETEVTVSVFEPGSGRRSRRTVVRVARPSMQHDVGVTATRTVLLDGPLVFDLDRVLAGGLPFAFETDQTMRVGILPRHPATSEASEPLVRWIDTGEPCFAYHVVNCHDAVDETTGRSLVVVDACKSDATNALGMARGFESGGVNGYVGEDAAGAGRYDQAEVKAKDEGKGEANAKESRAKEEENAKASVYSSPSSSASPSNVFSSFANRIASFFATPNFSSSSSTSSSSSSHPSSDDPRDARRAAAPAVGSHPNAVGEGRDVAAMWRWVLDADAGRLVSSERLCARASDFPAIHPGRVGVAYRYAYSAGYAPGTAPARRMDIPSFDRVLMHDVERKTHSEYLLGENRACGDVRFVPGNGADANGDELDGHVLVLSHALDETNPGAELLVLRPSADEESGETSLELVALVKVPVRIPFGFHVEFVPEEAIPAGRW